MRTKEEILENNGPTSDREWEEVTGREWEEPLVVNTTQKDVLQDPLE